MKKLTLAAFALFALPLFANANPAEVLLCSTPGDALDSMSLAVNTAADESDTAMISLTDAEPKVFATFSSEIAKGSLKKAYEAGSIELILKSEKSIEFGGAIYDAAYLLLKKEDSKFTGVLAAKGAVYNLNCVTAD